MTFLLCDVVFAGCKHVSGPREYDGILFYKLYLFVVCIENIVLQLCNPRYSGEYKLNYISLFNFPILRRIWSYITEEVPRAGEDRGVINPVDDHHPSVKLK